jgi:hypothetical protein
MGSNDRKKVWPSSLFYSSFCQLSISEMKVTAVAEKTTTYFTGSFASFSYTVYSVNGVKYLDYQTFYAVI